MNQALPMVYIVRHAGHLTEPVIHAWNGRVTAAASAR
jgi:hypothetical protein